MERRRIITLNVSLVSFREALSKVVDLGKTRTPSFACFANAHMAVEAHWNREFADRVNRANLVLADGKPIAFSCKFLYNKHQERVAGMDFMPAIIDSCAKEDLRIFLFGSTQVVLDKLTERIATIHPHLVIAGAISPPFREFTIDEAQTFINQINDSGANIVLVGMGCPKQELWMSNYSKDIRAVLLGVGGAFSVYAGLVSRSPVWMQRYSLEWFFRLLQEPRRMWRRYLVTNTWYLYLILTQLVLRRIKNINDNIN